MLNTVITFSIIIYFIIVFLIYVLIIYKTVKIYVYLEKFDPEFFDQIKEYAKKHKRKDWMYFIPFWHLYHFYLTIQLVSYSNEKTVKLLKEEMEKYIHHH